MQYLDKLVSLKLPLGSYAIFGSGPMAIRDIRESSDVDIIVKWELWDDLLLRYPGSLRSDPVSLDIKGIEVFKTWLQLTDKVDEMIDRAEFIKDLPFVRLEYVIEWKQSFGREKDITDIKLIEGYLASELANYPHPTSDQVAQ